MVDQWSGWNGIGRGVWGPGRVNLVARLEGRGDDFVIIAIGLSTCWRSCEKWARHANTEQAGGGCHDQIVGKPRSLRFVKTFVTSSLIIIQD
jgi:hypothetical protein